MYRGTSLIRNSPPPKDHHMTLGKVLLQGSKREVFLMSEVPLNASPLRLCQNRTKARREGAGSGLVRFVCYVPTSQGTRLVPTFHECLSHDTLQLARHACTGIPRSSETAAPWDPTVGPCLEPYGGRRGVGVFISGQNNKTNENRGLVRSKVVDSPLNSCQKWREYLGTLFLTPDGPSG